MTSLPYQPGITLQVLCRNRERTVHREQATRTTGTVDSQERDSEQQASRELSEQENDAEPLPVAESEVELSSPGAPQATTEDALQDATETESDEASLLDLRIEEGNEPATLSCVMKVEFEGKPAILKLYDHRHASQLRADNHIEPWTSDIATQHLEFIRSDAGRKFLHDLRYDDDFEEPDKGWSDVENEVYLQDKCAEMFTTECAVYNALARYQGVSIPRLFAQVSLPFHSSVTVQALKQSRDDLLEVKGILLESIPRFTLTSLPERAPQESWQSVCDQAVRLVDMLSDNSILDTDVRPSNIMVTPDPEQEHGYRTVMIDFAQCRFRKDTETDDEWGRAKWSEDEEGAIGVVMRGRLKKIGFALDYANSDRFVQWAGDD